MCHSIELPSTDMIQKEYGLFSSSYYLNNKPVSPKQIHSLLKNNGNSVLYEEDFDFVSAVAPISLITGLLITCFNNESLKQFGTGISVASGITLLNNNRRIDTAVEKYNGTSNHTPRDILEITQSLGTGILILIGPPMLAANNPVAVGAAELVFTLFDHNTEFQLQYLYVIPIIANLGWSTASKYDLYYANLYGFLGTLAFAYDAYPSDHRTIYGPSLRTELFRQKLETSK